jgi:hypothetical protein
MYICKDCKHVFETPKKYSEEGGSFINHYEGCPICAGAFEEAVECPVCNEYFLNDDMVYHQWDIGEIEDKICEGCRNDE